MPTYSELHCISNFTFLRGASHPEELVNRAVQLQYQALAITDECSLGGVVRAHLAARDFNLKLIIGTEIHLSDGLRLVLLACNRNGYGNLSELITHGRRNAEKGKYLLSKADLDSGLNDCLALWLPDADADETHGEWLKACFPNRCWLAIELLYNGKDHRRLNKLQHLADSTGIRAVAAGDVHMHRRQRRVLQDTLTAIRLRKCLPDCGFALYPNGERHLRTMDTLTRLYPLELLAETSIIAERCHFSLDELRYEYPDELVPAGKSPDEHLRQLTRQGMQRRWPNGASENVEKMVEHELKLIESLNYEPYFLTVHDIVRFARSKNILCQGRGSAANSAVCYCLGITEVDPARMVMLFERFISKERNEPPDIDVDFEHQRREEVLQYVYQKYGRDRAALTAVVMTYRRRSAVRDVGKALGLSLTDCERLNGIPDWSEDALPLSLKEIGFDPEAPLIRRLVYLVRELKGFPRHFSQHVGGMVISRGPLCRMVPVENATMPDRTIIQWDKDDLDALGLLKIDCLALGMLSAIHRALDMVSAIRGAPFALSDIPAEDTNVYHMIQRADTIGVFQIESRAQMSMLPRLKPKCFYDLVIEVAIVRPGPIQGGMVHPYLRRRRGEEKVDYPSEAVRGVLERTLGIPIFQEQVMQLAIVAAGFSPGEADQLSRGMAAWKRRGGMEPFRERFLNGMLERGYEAELAERLYRQIQGFGDYGFPESHAASFSLLVYVSCWLKYHYPAAFCAALLNSQPMGFYAPAQLVQDARNHQVEVRAVSANQSEWDCTLEPPDSAKSAMRLGLRQVKGLSEAGARNLVEARPENGFSSLEELRQKTGLSRRDLDCLARADALSGLSGHRRRAAWQVLGLEDNALPLAPTANTSPPPLPKPREGENLTADYASMGLSLRAHPLALLRSTLKQRQLLCAENLKTIPIGERAYVAGLVINRQRPGNAAGVIFATLEDESGHINVVVPARLVERQRRILVQSSLMAVHGRIQRDGDVIQLRALHLEDLSELLGKLETRSRDFR